MSQRISTGGGWSRSLELVIRHDDKGEALLPLTREKRLPSFVVVSISDPRSKIEDAFLSVMPGRQYHSAESLVTAGESDRVLHYGLEQW